MNSTSDCFDFFGVSTKAMSSLKNSLLTAAQFLPNTSSLAESQKVIQLGLEFTPLLMVSHSELTTAPLVLKAMGV